MNRMSRLVLAGIALAVAQLAPAHAARRVPVEDRTDVPVRNADGKPLNLADTRKAILIGARQRAWQIKSDEPGMIRLEYAYRRGNAGATIEIPYKAGSYSLTYASSYGMAEKESGGRRTIKSAYLQWTRNLVNDIDRAAMSGLKEEQPGTQRPQEPADDPDDKEPGK